MKPVAGECLKGKIYKLDYEREGFRINLGCRVNISVEMEKRMLLNFLSKLGINDFGLRLTCAT